MIILHISNIWSRNAEGTNSALNLRQNQLEQHPACTFKRIFTIQTKQVSSIKHHKFHAHPISSHPIYFECFVNAKSNLSSQINPNSTYTPRACGRDVQHGNGPKFLQLRFYSSDNFIQCLRCIQRQDQGPGLKGRNFLSMMAKLTKQESNQKDKHNIKRPQILGSNDLFIPPPIIND